MLSASSAFAHDIWSSIIRKGKDSEHEEVNVARIAAFAIGVIAIIIAVIGGSGLNVSFMVGLAFAVAASANFPALLLALTWRRFNTAGAITGVVIGVVSAIFLVIVRPKVWPGADTVTGSPIGWELSNPGIVSIPLGFLGCYLRDDAQQREQAERTFDELFVRSETASAPSARSRRSPQLSQGDTASGTWSAAMAALTFRGRAGAARAATIVANAIGTETAAGCGEDRAERRSPRTRRRSARR